MEDGERGLAKQQASGMLHFWLGLYKYMKITPLLIKIGKLFYAALLSICGCTWNPNYGHVEFHYSNFTSPTGSLDTGTQDWRRGKSITNIILNLIIYSFRPIHLPSADESSLLANSLVCCRSPFCYQRLSNNQTTMARHVKNQMIKHMPRLSFVRRIWTEMQLASFKVLGIGIWIGWSASFFQPLSFSDEWNI